MDFSNSRQSLAAPFFSCYLSTCMINSVSSLNQNNFQKKSNYRHKLVSYSGYAAMGFGTITGVSGFKSVKFPGKMKVHKISAWMAAISTFVHFAVIKRVDKIFQK